jgi:hypothetical protein
MLQVQRITVVCPQWISVCEHWKYKLLNGSLSGGSIILIITNQWINIFRIKGITNLVSSRMEIITKFFDILWVFFDGGEAASQNIELGTAI